MVINVSTRKYARAVRLPDDAGGDLPGHRVTQPRVGGLAPSLVALTRSKLKAWLASPATISISWCSRSTGSMSAIT